MKYLDEVLELLKDGDWHYLGDLREEVKLSPFKMKLLAHFFVSYGFCDMTRSGNMIKLKPEVIHFFEALEEVEM